MLHACDQKLGVTENLENFCEQLSHLILMETDARGVQ
jgi:hypothetical protein